MRQTKASKALRVQHIGYLKERIAEGSTVFCIIRHVSRSGMRRYLDLYTIGEHGGKPYMFRHTYSAAIALESAYNRTHEAITVDGCGMDMCFATVDALSWILFGKSGALTHSTL